MYRSVISGHEEKHKQLTVENHELREILASSLSELATLTRRCSRLQRSHLHSDEVFVVVIIVTVIIMSSFVVVGFTYWFRASHVCLYLCVASSFHSSFILACCIIVLLFIRAPFYVLLVFVAVCSVFWLFWLSCHYLPSDWLERPLRGSLSVARGSSP